jgi:hypothetical protein
MTVTVQAFPGDGVDAPFVDVLVSGFTHQVWQRSLGHHVRERKIAPSSIGIAYRLAESESAGDNVVRVMHNDQMESQVVVGPRGKPSSLHIASTPVDWSKENESETRRLHLGSQDLVRVAGFAAENGFKLVRFYLSDPYLQPLGSAEEQTISDELVEIFNKYDAQEVRSALRGDYEGLYVVGIELLSRETGFRIHLRREGFIDTAVPEIATNLLTRAWQKLRLA